MTKLRLYNGQFMKKAFHASLKDEWDAMINRGIIPIFEHQTGDDSYLVVNLEFTDQGIEFSFDIRDFFEPKICFGGDVVQPYPLQNDIWLLPFDPFFTRLDHYLQQIDSEILEGFLLPNDLYYEGVK